jgi:hypothetical protein
VQIYVFHEVMTVMFLEEDWSATCAM